MKKMLPNILCGIAMLGLSVQVLVAQEAVQPKVTPNPSFKKSSSKLSPELQKIYELKVPATTRAESTEREIIVPSELEPKIQLIGDRIVIEVVVQGESSQTRAELEKLGMKVYGVYGRMISGTMPVASLQKISSLKNVRFARAATMKVNSSTAKLSKNNNTAALLAPVISQGDTAQRSNIAKSLYNVNGKGVKVGVISDSYDNRHGAEKGVLAGELPGIGNPFGYTKPVEVLSDADSLNTDEGRGMLEIVHDVAPGAELAFHTADFGQAAFATGILKLAAAGCKVIVDDIVYLFEPFFQDGIVAQAVDIVKSKGVTYFSAAGNQYDHSYESVFRESRDTSLGKSYGTLHNFSASGQVPRYFMPIEIPTNTSFTPILQWDQSFYSQGGEGAESDVDLWLLDANFRIVWGSNTDNVLYGDPVEGFGIINRGQSTRFYLAIALWGGPAPAHIKFIDFDPYVSFVATTPSIPGTWSPTIVQHPNAAGAITAAAAPYLWTPAYGLDTPRVELFSSIGGNTLYLDKDGYRMRPVIRKKPDLTGPDGGNTSFFWSDSNIDQDTIPNFFGTSAAAPHAAGVAALMIQSTKLGTITPDQIRGVLTDKSLDMDHYRTPGFFDKGFDFNTGSGFIQADKAVAAVRFPNVFVKDLQLGALCSDNPAATRKWRISNPNPFPVEFTWFITGLNAEQGHIMLSPGDSVLTTNTYYLGSLPVPNILVISWEDNFGFPHFDTENGNKGLCGIVAADSENENIVAGTESFDRLNTAAVYPNPIVRNFKVYVSFASTQNVSLELYSLDGKQLYKKVAASKGVYDIDASRFKSGVYLLKVSQGAVVKTMKLLKQ